ncbi:MAG TPA: hypothetical protein ENK91_16710 [Bacteroidetes bacterium]|nr:hypothetical protein [Bacteroidota bacterium]
MKNFMGLMIVFALIVSCNKPEYNVTENPEDSYMRLWAVSFCGNSLDIKEDTPELWKDKVLDSLNAWEYDVLEYHLGFIEQEPFIGCGNCIRTGDYLDVIVPDNQREKLKKLGFQE